MALRQHKRLAERLDVGAATRVLRWRVERHDDRHERPVAVRRLVRQLRRSIILDHQRAINKEPRVRLGRRTKAATNEREEAGRERGVEPALRAWQRVHVRVAVGVGHREG